MQPIRIIKTIDQKMCDALPEFQPLAGLKVEIIVREPEVLPSDIPRRAGFLKGKIWMSEDFDEPMNDFKEYM